MANRRQKPPDTLQDRRPSRMTSAPVLPDHIEDSGLPALATDVPDAPKGLSPATKAMWDVFWTSPLRPFIIGVDRFVIDELFWHYTERQKLRTNYERKKTGEGSTGQTRESHYWKQILDCNRDIAAREAQLGIGALNRMRLNVTFSEAANGLQDLLRAMNAGAGDDDNWAEE